MDVDVYWFRCTHTVFTFCSHHLPLLFCLVLPSCQQVKTASAFAGIKTKVNQLVNDIAAASYTVSTQTSTVLSCKWKATPTIVGNTDGTELCASNRCLQVNREAWVCWKGHEQGSDQDGATTCKVCNTFLVEIICVDFCFVSIYLGDIFCMRLLTSIFIFSFSFSF